MINWQYKLKTDMAKSHCLSQYWSTFIQSGVRLNIIDHCHYLFQSRHFYKNIELKKHALKENII